MITKNIWIMNHYRNAVCAIVATLAATAAMAQSAIEALQFNRQRASRWIFLAPPTQWGGLLSM